MLNNISLENTLFFDIETVSQFSGYEAMDDSAKPLWEQKGGWFARQQGKEWDDEVAAETYGSKAAIYAEFGKVVVISVGYLRKSGDSFTLKLKSFASADEREVLQGFSNLLNSHYNNPARHYLCGHNIKEFDIPYVCRRLLINNMPIPDMINVTGKKPWETTHFLDTLSLWKFGDFKNFTSLNLLANVLNIPTPKDDIDGSQVGRVFWEENDLNRIAVYCEKDVVTSARVLFLKQCLSTTLPVVVGMVNTSLAMPK